MSNTERTSSWRAAAARSVSSSGNRCPPPASMARRATTQRSQERPCPRCREYGRAVGCRQRVTSPDCSLSRSRSRGCPSPHGCHSSPLNRASRIGHDPRRIPDAVAHRGAAQAVSRTRPSGREHQWWIPMGRPLPPTRTEPIQSTSGQRRLGMDWLSGTPVVRLHGNPTFQAHDRHHVGRD